MHYVSTAPQKRGMDVVADGRTACEEAQRQLEADNLGEPRQPQDRHLRSEPAFDPARGRSGDACGRAGPVEAEVPVPASKADLPARPANGRVGAQIGTVKEAFDRCHAAIVGGVTYIRLNGELPVRARSRFRCTGTESPPAPLGRALVPRPRGPPASPPAPALRARASPACVRRNTALAIPFALQVLAAQAQEGCRPVSPAGSWSWRWQEDGWPTQGTCRWDRWTRVS